MQVPAYDKLLNPTLAALRHLGGSASITELLEQIIEDLQFPQDVVEQPHPGRGNRTELEYRLAWARTYLKKYGMVENTTRGVWVLTPKGLEQEAVDPQDVVRFVREQSDRERRGRAKPAETVDPRAGADGMEDEMASWREPS